MVSKMSGGESSEQNMSNSQIQATAGGELLKAEVQRSLEVRIDSHGQL